MSSQSCRVPHMFACVSMNSGVLQWWECTSADQRPKSSIFLFHTPPYFLKHSLSLNVELTESARLAAQKVPQRAIYLASTKISGLVPPKIKLRSHNYGNKCITKASPQPSIEFFEIESPSLYRMLHVSQQQMTATGKAREGNSQRSLKKLVWCKDRGVNNRNFEWSLSKDRLKTNGNGCLRKNMNEVKQMLLWLDERVPM